MNKSSPRSAFARFIPIVLWVFGVVAGSGYMIRHEFTAGEDAAVPDELPLEFSSGDSGTHAVTLIMTVHPECPCTASSVEQLERLIARNPGRIRTVALLRVSEAEGSRDAQLTNYGTQLAALPDATLIADLNGRLATDLGGTVSGTILVYDAQHKLRFHGGLTASRGHAGSSRGMEFVESILHESGSEEIRSTPAFGCSLLERAGI